MKKKISGVTFKARRIKLGDTNLLEVYCYQGKIYGIVFQISHEAWKDRSFLIAEYRYLKGRKA